MSQGPPPPNPIERKTKWDLDGDILRLRNNAGEAFDRFINSFEAYVDQVTVTVTEAPPDQILRAQGHAQMARKLLGKFKDALQK